MFRQIHLVQGKEEDIKLLNLPESTFFKEDTFSISEDGTKITPLKVGKFTLNQNLSINVIYNIDPDPNWSKAEKYEYLHGVGGTKHQWLHTFDCKIMQDFVVDRIDSNKSIHENVKSLACSLSEIIEAKWSGTDSYEDEDDYNTRPPDYWTSSSQIFDTYATCGKVKYGQCGTFAELLVTILRFLGIPCRAVKASNLHADRSRSMGVNVTLSVVKSDDNTVNISRFNPSLFMEQIIEKGLPERDDSLWNFHYWVEYYCNEWYVIDPTPFIESFDVPDCKVLGPCPRDNIKRGIKCLYDFDYLFAMVNSPFRFWAVQTYKSQEIMYVNGQYYPLHNISKGYVSIISKAELNNHILTVEARRSNWFDLYQNLLPYYTASFESIILIEHKDHPIIFTKVNNKIVYELKIEDKEEEYTVQIVEFKKDTILKVTKYVTSLDKLPVYSIYNSTSNISILTTRTNDKHWWNQLI